MKNHFRRPPCPSFAALGLGVLLGVFPPGAGAERFTAPETRFTPDVGQPIFPAGNLNVFKQFVVTFPSVEHRVGKNVEIDLFFDTLRFGGSLTAGLGGRAPGTPAAFGLELGLCFGGNANFDLGFQPTVTLPDRYPSEVPIPLIVSEGFQAGNSYFETTFPPLGKAYADLIFELGAHVRAHACVFGCTDFGIDLSTALVPGFALPNRCDPALNAPSYYSLELASFNRNDDNCVRLLNVLADNPADFFANPYIKIQPDNEDEGQRTFFTANPANNTLQVNGFQNGEAVEVASSGRLPGGLFARRVYYVINSNAIAPNTLQLSTKSGGSPVTLTDAGTGNNHQIFPSMPDLDSEADSGDFGDLYIGAPTVATDSRDSRYNTLKALTSTGAEDIMGLGIDVTKIASAILPKTVPPFSDSGSVGPIDYSYTLAALSLGPAVKLQTDFELTWDLEVTGITFTEPGTANPREVKLRWPGDSPYFATGDGAVVSSFVPTQLGTVHLTNCGPRALPMVEMITPDPPTPPPFPPVEVAINYVLKPKLETLVSTPMYGELNYEALAASAGISRVGSLGFGPLLEGDQKFKFGEFTVYDGDPSPIEAGKDPGTGQLRAGTLTFTMQAAGPPTYDWAPDQIPGNRGWTTRQPLGNDFITNWLEVSSDPPSMAFYPGIGGTTNSDVTILGGGLGPFLRNESVEVSSLRVVDLSNSLDLVAVNNVPCQLAIGGGLLENNGYITLTTDSFPLTQPPAALKLDSPDAMLCGHGIVSLSGESILEGYTGVGPFSFCNYNTIAGTGRAMDHYFINSPKPYDLLHLWDFEADAGDPADVVNGVTGQLLDGALISEPGTGHSGGRALQLGIANNDTMRVTDVDLFNDAAARDQLTVTFWQKQDPAGASIAQTNFQAQSPSAVENVAFRVHAPWSDDRIYYDTAGCCGATETRINTGVRGEDFTQWTHFAFVKDGANKQVWIDGILVASGVNTLPLPVDSTDLWIGSEQGGIRSMHGLLDDVAVFALPLDATAIGLLAGGTRPDALPFSGKESGGSTINNMGILRAERNPNLPTDFLLSTSANHVINQGAIRSELDAAVTVYGDRFSNVGPEGVIWSTARGAETYISFDEIVNTGSILAYAGGSVLISPFMADRATFDAGQAVVGSSGCFLSEITGSVLDILNADVNGGCFLPTKGGGMITYDTSFAGSLIRIGDYTEGMIDPSSGIFTLGGSGQEPFDSLLENVCLVNHGTLRIDANVEVRNPMDFSNNGTVEVLANKTLHIGRTTVSTPGASATAKNQPGAANGAGSTLVGGTWDIAGTLEIEGAAFTAMGANTASASTASGSIDDLGVGDRNLEQRPEDDPSRLLSGGAPARVILRGSNASFPALLPLEVNGGDLSIQESATLVLANDPQRGFTNQGRMEIGSGSLVVNGSYLQTGDSAETDVSAGGQLLSGDRDYQILGGTVSVGADAFGLVENGGWRSLAGTSRLRIESPIIDSGQTDPLGNPISKQSPVIFEGGPSLLAIEAGSSLIVNGRLTATRGADGIFFPGLTTLSSIAGAFRLEGSGKPYSPELTLGDLTNTGDVEVTGSGSKLKTGTYVQSAGSLRIGPDAQVELGSGSTIAGGEVVVEIGSRPRGTRRAGNFSGPEPQKLGPLIVESGFSFNNRLVVEFTGEMAASLVDIGDSWQIVPRGEVVTGFASVEYRLNGSALPAGWLPAGTEFQTFTYQDDLGGPGTGLGVRLLPVGGTLQSYREWAESASRNLDPFSPFVDGNGNGEIDLREFFFGLEGRERSHADHYLEAGFVVVANPNAEDSEDRFFEFSYVRPRPATGPSPDATYIPYYSLDLLDWNLAPMLIVEIGPGPEPDLERVALRSSIPVTEERLFVRIQPNYDPDDFEPGLIPEKPLQWRGNFVFFGAGAFQQTVADNNGGLAISYDLEPGRVVFFNIGSANTVEDVFGTDIYHQESDLETAVVHAGALGNGDSGIVQVTFGTNPASYTASTRNEGTNDQVISETIVPGANDLSYTIELVAAQSGE